MCFPTSHGPSNQHLQCEEVASEAQEYQVPIVCLPVIEYILLANLTISNGY